MRWILALCASSSVDIVRLDRRTYSPTLREADLPDVTVPWLGERTLRYEFA